MRSRNIHLCMCVLLTSLHLIAILWKKFVLEGIVLFFALRPIFYVLCFYSLRNLSCVSSDWYSIKTQRDHSAAVELFLWVAPSFLTPCHTDHSLGGLPAHPCSQFRFLPECSWAPLTAVAAWKPPEGQRAAESSGWRMCSPSREEPSPGTPTLPAVQGLRTVSYLVQLSNSQW